MDRGPIIGLGKEAMMKPSTDTREEHLYNMTNIGLNIGSDGLCEVSMEAK